MLAAGDCAKSWYIACGPTQTRCWWERTGEGWEEDVVGVSRHARRKPTALHAKVRFLRDQLMRLGCDGGRLRKVLSEEEGCFPSLATPIFPPFPERLSENGIRELDDYKRATGSWETASSRVGRRD